MDERAFLRFYTDTPKYTHPPGLEMMGRLMARLGNPQAGLRCVHIAGTNGKGSCAAMTAAILRAAGYRTGLFTSPDLLGPEERIKVDGVDITLAEFAPITQAVKAASAGLPEPSFFEKLTAAAFLYFHRRQCDYVVLETGLGGRLDATNIIKSPACSVLMPIGLDHTAQLGGTLSAIAGEKCGILKPGCPAVSAPQPPEAAQVIRAACRQRGAALREVDIKKLTLLSHSPAGQRFSYGTVEDVFLPLLGAHQARNACAAIETARLLGVDEGAIRAGLAAARWPCRLEFFPGGDGAPDLLLDGAHNGHGAAALAAALAEYFPGRRFTMVMGVMADKDYRDILARMEPLAARFICLAPDSPRALPAEALAGLVRTVPARCARSPEEALALARSYGEPVCAFGSLYYVGRLRALAAEDKANRNKTGG